jgi:hypothetical protein
MIRTPSERKISSKGPENFESRSRITNRMWSSRSPIARLRACWVTHAESGFLVTPRTCTRRERRWIANSTYIVASTAVSTVKKSRAKMPVACELRNSLQVGPSRRGAGPSPFGTEWVYATDYTFSGSKCRIRVVVEYGKRPLEKEKGYPAAHILTVYSRWLSYL